MASFLSDSSGGEIILALAQAALEFRQPGSKLDFFFQRGSGDRLQVGLAKLRQ